jgi:hypothetical protein
MPRFVLHVKLNRAAMANVLHAAEVRRPLG